MSLPTNLVVDEQLSFVAHVGLILIAFDDLRDLRKERLFRTGGKGNNAVMSTDVGTNVLPHIKTGGGLPRESGKAAICEMGEK